MVFPDISPLEHSNCLLKKRFSPGRSIEPFCPEVSDPPEEEEGSGRRRRRRVIEEIEVNHERQKSILGILGNLSYHRDGCLDPDQCFERAPDLSFSAFMYCVKYYFSQLCFY